MKYCKNHFGRRQHIPVEKDDVVFLSQVVKRFLRVRVPVKQKHVFQIVIYVGNNDWQKCDGNAIAGEKVSPTK